MRPIIDLWFVTNVVLMGFAVSTVLLYPPVLGLAILMPMYWLYDDINSKE